MKKTDLLALVENITDEQEINEVILGHDEFKDLGKVDLTKLSTEDFNKLITENAAVSGYYKSKIDSAIGTAITTHDKKFNEEKLPKIIEEELKKRSNEGKTPDQIKLEEMQKQIEDMKTEKARAELSSKYTKILTEKGLNADLVSFVLGADEEATNANIEKIQSIINSSVDAGVKEKFKDNSYKPPVDESFSGIVTKEQFNKMGYKERLALYSENKDLYNQLNEN